MNHCVFSLCSFVEVSVMREMDQKILTVLQGIRDELKLIRENMLDKGMFLAGEDEEEALRSFSRYQHPRQQGVVGVGV